MGGRPAFLLTVICGALVGAWLTAVIHPVGWWEKADLATRLTRVFGGVVIGEVAAILAFVVYWRLSRTGERQPTPAPLLLEHHTAAADLSAHHQPTLQPCSQPAPATARVAAPSAAQHQQDGAADTATVQPKDEARQFVQGAGHDGGAQSAPGRIGGSHPVAGLLPPNRL